MATQGMFGKRRITSFAMDVFPLALPPATPTIYGAMGLPSASYHGWRPASVMIVVRLYERRGCAEPPCRRYIELLTCESMEAVPRSSEPGVDTLSCISGPVAVIPGLKRTSQGSPSIDLGWRSHQFELYNPCKTRFHIMLDTLIFR